MSTITTSSFVIFHTYYNIYFLKLAVISIEIRRLVLFWKSVIVLSLQGVKYLSNSMLLLFLFLFDSFLKKFNHQKSSI